MRHFPVLLRHFTMIAMMFASGINSLQRLE
jgi:hypothetical protein